MTTRAGPGRGAATAGRPSRSATATRRPWSPTAPPPVRCTQEVTPVSVTRRDDGSYLLDFGQNLVGRLAITVAGAPGSRVTLRHAEEVIDGELATAPLRQARATDEYILRGGGTERWEPRFTIHGFRYATITGWPGELRAESADRPRLPHRHAADRRVRVQ